MKDKINNQVLCVLKRHKAISKVELGYEPIENKLPSELIHLYKLCESDLDGGAILDFIDSKPELQKMLGRYNYCTRLDAAYEGLRDINKEIKEYFKTSEKFSSPEDQDKFFKSRKESLKSTFKHRELAYNIDLAYQQCAANKLIISHSHREVGWTTKHRLDNKFQIEFKTNFGYGSVSYFYTKLRYKDIDIIPFSEWVNYRDSQYETLIQYSQRHSVDHESWFDAISYVCEAYNLSIDDETAFISKYLVSECEKMAKGLESILSSNNPEFKVIKGTHPHGPFKGHQLVEIKGEKISGALNFIQSIISYDKVAGVKEFVERIEKCNKTIQPILIKQLEVIIEELNPLEIELDILEPEYEEVDKVNDDYSLKRKELRTELERLDEFDFEKMKKEFKTKYPEFEQFEKNFQELKVKYVLLKSKIEALQTSRRKIDKYNKAIDKYFQVEV